jgi:tetratricopeptide (TPR) repeat protein
VFSFLQPLPQDADKTELPALEARIQELKVFIARNPEDPGLDEKRLALAQMVTRAGSLLIETPERGEAEPPAPEEGTKQRDRKQQALEYFKNAILCHNEVVQSFATRSEALREKGEQGQATRLEGAARRILLKNAWLYWTMKDLFSPEEFDRIDYQTRALNLVRDLSMSTPVEDPVSLWSWIYQAFFAAETGLEDEADRVLDAIPRFVKSVYDLPETLSGANDVYWAVTDPLEVCYQRILSGQGEEEEPAKVLALARPYVEACRVSRVRPGPFGERILLAACRTLGMQEKPSTLKKRMIARRKTDSLELLIDIADRNAGNTVGGEALALLEEWEEKCNKVIQRGRLTHCGFLHEVLLPMANHHRLSGDYEKALAYYSKVLNSLKTEKLMARYGAKIHAFTGICYLQMGRFPEAIDSFEKGPGQADLKQEPELKTFYPYWYRALEAKAKASGQAMDDTNKLRMRDKLAALGIEPKESALEMLSPAPLRIVADPPRRILEASPFEETPLLVLKPVKKAKHSKAVYFGLDWLVRHQDLEGFWDCDGFDMQCSLNRCNGKGKPVNDVGVTGLALLALLGPGDRPMDGSYARSVLRGLQYLCAVQDPETGSLCASHYEVKHVGKRVTQTVRHSIPKWMYNNATATLALLRAYRLFPWPPLAPHVQRALEFAHETRNPGKAWRYNRGNEIDPKEMNDVSVTGWMVRCLAEAARGDLGIHEQDIKDALLYIDEMTDSATGRTGYNQRGNYCSREAGDAEIWPYEVVESMTGVGMICRILCGEILGDLESQEEMLEKGVRLLLANPPKWDRDAGTIDYYYWYHGTRAMREMGGRAWKVWKGHQLKALLDNQRTDGCEKGSWDPQRDPWGNCGGRVYSTALCTMALQVIERR